MTCSLVKKLLWYNERSLSASRQPINSVKTFTAGINKTASATRIIGTPLIYDLPIIRVMVKAVSRNLKIGSEWSIKQCQ